MVEPGPAQRLLVIDIDGLRQDVFHKALSERRIPALERLLGNDAVHLDPVSTAPSITFCAQSSIFTGAPPEAHGIIGNQFFDRFARQTRFYAFDVGDALAYDDAVLTFSGPIGLVGQVLNPDTPTLYEQAARLGKTSTVVYNMVSRGAAHWIRPSLVEIGLFTKGGGLLGVSAEQYDSQMIAKTLEHLRSGARPDLLTIYFMGLDHTSHEHGPGAQLNYLIRVVDPLAGQLVEELEKMKWLDGTLAAVVSDHGQIEVIPDDVHSLRMSFPFDREMGYLFDALGLDVHDKPREGAWCDAVVASNGGLAHVYIRRKAGARDAFGRSAAENWSAPPRFETDVLPVARAFWEAHTTGRYAPDLRGALAGVLVRNVEQSGWQADYLALTSDGRLIAVEQYLADHPEIQAADGPARLRQMACRVAGDLLLISNYSGGYYFGGLTTGVHGGLHPADSLAVASLGWVGATAEQQAALRQAAETVVASRRDAESRQRASVADLTPILMRMLQL